MTLRKSCWRHQFSPDETIQRVRPHEHKGYIANPHRGTTTFQRFNGDPVTPNWTWDDRHGPIAFQPFSGDPSRLVNERYPHTTLSYCRWAWCDLEPRKGAFRWEVIDGALAAARARGQTLQLRLQPFLGAIGVPNWYWDTGAALDPAASTPACRIPDHNDPRYLEHFGDTIRMLGERYDGHPALESFDIAYGGSCGETGGNASPATARALVDVYLASFRKTQLLSLLGTEGCAYGQRVCGQPMGWRTDCYGDIHFDGQGYVPDHLCWNHMYDAYPENIALCGVQDAWRKAPVTLETCWTVPYWHERSWDLDFILEQGLRYHATVFMPKSAFFPESWREKLDAFDRRLGYRFVLRQMRLPMEALPGQAFDVAMFINNIGVAPIYRPYRLAYRFAQEGVERIVESAQDIRTWMPDDQTWFHETIALPPDLRLGEVAVSIGIIDPVTRRPVVRFAIDETDADGWHPMTHMHVGTNPDEVERKKTWRPVVQPDRKNAVQF